MELESLLPAVLGEQHDESSGGTCLRVHNGAPSAMRNTEPYGRRCGLAHIECHREQVDRELAEVIAEIFIRTTREAWQLLDAKRGVEPMDER